MYDYRKACELGYVTPCTAPLTKPVTVHGYYRCTNDHAHYVYWVSNPHRPHVSTVGFHWGFVGALDAAEDAASAYADAGTPEYERLYRGVMEKLGYRHVLRPPTPQETPPCSSPTV